MEHAQRDFREVVASMPWRVPDVPVTSNIDASSLRTPAQIVDELGSALCAPVEWDKAVRAMSGDGVQLFVEAGPGDVLSKLVRRIARKSWTFPLSDDDEGLASRDYPDTSGIPK
jgi:[acyl-carrier-protein] S-malonyltransferase